MEEKVDSFLKVEEVFYPSAETVKRAWIKDYDKAYAESIKDIPGFWEKAALELEWFSPWSQVLQWDYPWAKWFVGATCNITHNCLDRHLKTWRKNKVALIWVGEDNVERVFSYAELYRKVCRCANALKALGVRKGDRVAIYLPKIPEQTVAMLACARIGAIHTVVYSGFSAPALASRIEDSQPRVIIRAADGVFAGEGVPLKPVVDEAVAYSPCIEKVVVVRRQKPGITLSSPKELDWDDWLNNQQAVCAPEVMDAEDPLYFLYTSGTTGKPKGVQHVHGGYMVGTYLTTKLVFDLKDEDVYFCVADPGWVTGHSYIVYGPLLNGATILMAEGKPDYPTPGSAARPFLGIEADVVDREGNSLPPNTGGFAVIKKPWPSMLRTIYKDPDRYKVYWNTIPGCYTAGDVCRKDEDGYFFFMGRADDVIKVAGNRIGTAEVESALVSHPAVAEAAVIGKPHKTAGESIKAFLILKHGFKESPELIQQMKDHVKHELGKIAVPQEIEIVPSLPKTRSGKIMRRVLKAKELGQNPGDISTLED